MRFTKIVPVILIAVALFSCQTGSKKAEVIKLDAASLEKSWTQNSVSSTSDGFLFENQASMIASKFQVRNFEINAKLKTTLGAEGAIVFSVADVATPDKGYMVKINNSDYREGNPQKTGSLSRIRNNFVRTANNDEWFILNISVVGNHGGFCRAIGVIDAAIR